MPLDVAYTPTMPNAVMHNKNVSGPEQNANSTELKEHWCVYVGGGGGFLQLCYKTCTE